jgi:hypothetical protein
MSKQKFQVGDKVTIVRHRQYGTGENGIIEYMNPEEETVVDSAGEDLIGQTGVIEEVRRFGYHRGAINSRKYQYFVRTKNPSLYSEGLHDFMDDELEAAE